MNVLVRAAGEFLLPRGVLVELSLLLGIVQASWGRATFGAAISRSRMMVSESGSPWIGTGVKGSRGGMISLSTTALGR